MQKIIGIFFLNRVYLKLYFPRKIGTIFIFSETVRIPQKVSHLWHMCWELLTPVLHYHEFYMEFINLIKAFKFLTDPMIKCLMQLKLSMKLPKKHKLNIFCVFKVIHLQVILLHVALYHPSQENDPFCYMWCIILS